MTEIILPDSMPHRIQPDIARKRIEAFARRFGSAHLFFAQHAAFPLTLTPHLAYRLWAAFQQDIHGQKLGIPWIAVADLLLSNLYDEVSHELYEMNIVVREVLLHDLQENAGLGSQRVQELSAFLLKDIKHQLESHDPDVRDLASLQRWTALAYVQPGETAHELARALQNSLERDNKPELLRLASLAETFAQPLATFAPLLTYAHGIGYFARSDMKRAWNQMKDLAVSEQSVYIQDILLPIPWQVRAAATQISSLKHEYEEEGFEIREIQGRQIPFAETSLRESNQNIDRVSETVKAEKDSKTVSNWRELLGQLIRDPGERERLAKEIRVRPVTLQRWTDGISYPRLENIRALLKHIPRATYPLFMHLLHADFPELVQETLPDESLVMIPSEFYARVLSNLALTPGLLHRQSMQDLILQQMLQHLDSERRGIAITLAVCVPPRPGRKVRSLCEIGSLATPPWPHTPVAKPMFLGMESLVGHASAYARPSVINSRGENPFTAQWIDKQEQSRAAFPILLQARLVGGFTVSSTQEHFFTESRLAVVEQYACLVACIFDPEEFFNINEIDLKAVPPFDQQLSHLNAFNQLVSQKLAEAKALGQQITLQQARVLVLQDLEDIMLQTVEAEKN